MHNKVVVLFVQVVDLLVLLVLTLHELQVPLVVLVHVPVGLYM